MSTIIFMFVAVLAVLVLMRISPAFDAWAKSVYGWLVALAGIIVTWLSQNWPL